MKRQNKKQKEEECYLGGSIKRPGCAGTGEHEREEGSRVEAGGVSSLRPTQGEGEQVWGWEPASEPAKLARPQARQSEEDRKASRADGQTVALWWAS